MQPNGCWLKLDELGLEQRFYRHQGVEHRAGYGRVDLHYSQSFHGLGSPAFAAKGKVGDVDTLLAEDCADFADDAGDVEVATDEEIAFERRFDVDAVEFK